MIYIFDELDSLKYDAALLELVPKGRSNKIKSYRWDIDKKLSWVSYILLRYGMYNEYGVNNEFEFAYEKYMKPYIDGWSQYKFNISHCKYGVICALSKKEVGVDIQEHFSFDENFVNSILSLKEKRILGISENKTETMTLFWTMKEAYGKKIGKGLNYDFKNTDFDVKFSNWYKANCEFYFNYIGKAYAYSICSEEKLEIKNVNYMKIVDFCNRILGQNCF